MHRDHIMLVHKGIAKNFLVFILFSTACGNLNESHLTDDQLASEMEMYLNSNLLHIWYPRIIDEENGGFLTNFTAQWEEAPPHQKMIVSQARDVWTACKAAERYPDDPRYLQAAKHGFKFLKNHMWDDKYGGFYFYLDQEGVEIPYKEKKAYGIAFGIYALAAYTKLTQSAEALELAKKAFFWLDAHSHDHIHGGYYDWITREGLSCAGKKFDPKAFPSELKSAKWKDYNSSIHLLEAFAELYAVWPDKLLEKRLTEMLTLIRDNITTEKGYMNLYFEADWAPVSFRNTSRHTILENKGYDHVSFGHDIETAFLILEASAALGLKNDTLTHHAAKKMIDHTIDNGFDRNYTSIFQEGYYFQLNEPVTVLRDTKDWWSQAEGLNALLLFSQLYPNEARYKQIFLNLWEYVKEYLIDRDHGGWYSKGLDKEPGDKLRNKAYTWKSCYHNGRSLMNCIDMLRGHGNHIMQMH